MRHHWGIFFLIVFFFFFLAFLVCGTILGETAFLTRREIDYDPYASIIPTVCGTIPFEGSGDGDGQTLPTSL